MILGDPALAKCGSDFSKPLCCKELSLRVPTSFVTLALTRVKELMTARGGGSTCDAVASGGMLIGRVSRRLAKRRSATFRVNETQTHRRAAMHATVAEDGRCKALLSARRASRAQRLRCCADCAVFVLT